MQSDLSELTTLIIDLSVTRGSTKRDVLERVVQLLFESYEAQPGPIVSDLQQDEGQSKHQNIARDEEQPTQEESDATRARIDKWKTDCKALAAKVEDLTRSNKDLEAAKLDLNNRVKELETRNEDAERKQREVQILMQDTEARNEQLNVTVKEDRDTTLELKLQIDEQEGCKDKMQRNIEDLQQQVHSLTVEKKSATKGAQKLSIENTKLTNVNAKLTKEVDDLASKNNRLKKEVQDRKDYGRTYNDKYGAAKATMKALQTQLASMKSQAQTSGDAACLMVETSSCPSTRNRSAGSEIMFDSPDHATPTSARKKVKFDDTYQQIPQKAISHRSSVSLSPIEDNFIVVSSEQNVSTVQSCEGHAIRGAAARRQVAAEPSSAYETPIRGQVLDPDRHSPGGNEDRRRKRPLSAIQKVQSHLGLSPSKSSGDM